MVFWKKFLPIIGLLFIIAGILCNEYVLAFLFGVDYQSGPERTRVLILSMAVFFMVSGVVLLKRKEKIAAFLADKELLPFARTFYSISLVVTLLFGGGILVMIFVSFGDKLELFQNLKFLIPSSLSLLGSASYLIYRREKELFQESFLVCFSVLVVLYATNFALVFFSPAWPAVGLHRVKPELGKFGWGRIVAMDNTAMGFNSWGQRDHERSIRPEENVRRVAFIGDSYLEQSTRVPVSVLTESELHREDLEILNLGVTATSLGEYYFRLKNIAIPLGVRHCIIFFYEGNDFIHPGYPMNVRLPSFAGITALYPRDSLFSMLRLFSLNHLLTNDKRPFLEDVRLRTPSLDHLRFMKIRQTPDEELPSLFADWEGLKGESKISFRNRLSAPSIRPVFNIFRNPDKGLFRTYFLFQKIMNHTMGKKEDFRKPVSGSVEWIKKIKGLCTRYDISLTVVMVPVGLYVDEKIWDEAAPVMDLSQYQTEARQSSQELMSMLAEMDVDVVDLHPVLRGRRGTYLNLDGHWSDYGADVVARHMAEHIERTILHEPE